MNCKDEEVLKPCAVACSCVTIVSIATSFVLHTCNNKRAGRQACDGRLPGVMLRCVPCEGGHACDGRLPDVVFLDLALEVRAYDAQTASTIKYQGKVATGCRTKLLCATSCAQPPVHCKVQQQSTASTQATSYSVLTGCNRPRRQLELVA
eukprot:scaffold885_cov22-Tisochrysis_lutea.AAC.1